MNIQALIKKYEEKYETVFGFPVIQLNQILEDLKQLDEPQKVVVPQFVADWIERERKSGGDLEDLFDDIVCEQKHLEWFREEENMNLVARAWLDGYEVEREKRYTIKFKNIRKETRYLKCDRVVQNWYFGVEQYSKETKIYHTRKELEDAGFDWVFDCPGIEIEEVEE